MRDDETDQVVADALAQRQQVKKAIEKALDTDLSEATIAWKDPEPRRSNLA